MSDAPTTPPENELDDSTMSEEAPPPGFPAPEDPVLAGIAAGFPSVRFDLLLDQHVAFVPGDDLVEFATAARDAGFESCMDVTAVDHLRRRPRFDVVYQLLSMQHVLRLRIRVGVAADDPTLPTLTDVYAGANFYEREVFDMFGIVFAGHPDLTRILMPDDWEGHPLRKDYPVGSVPVQFKSSPEGDLMANPPDIVTGDTEAPTTEAAPPDPATDASAEQHRRRLHDFWAAGTEEPSWVRRATDEGAQEMLQEESPEELGEQRGSLVVDDYELSDDVSEDERQIINMGPQHPSTHGVLRLQLELEGEMIRRVKPIIGYLHTGMEKTAETLNYLQGTTNVTRMDYLSPFFNELCFSLATEQLLEVEVPPRAQAIRVLMTELNRVASHLLWMATQGMDVGAVSMMIYGWREREPILAFFEKVTGLRMNHNYIRPGGVAADLPDGWEDDIDDLLEVVPAGIDDYETILSENPIWIERTQGVGIITPEECRAFGIGGPIGRASGVDWDLRKAIPYCGIDQYDFDVPTGKHGDVYDRYLVRIEEMRQSLRIVEQVTDDLPSGDYRTEDRKVTPPPRARIDESMEALIHHFKIFTEGFKVPAGETYVAVESPRGELGMYLVSDGGAKPWRLHVRAPSFANVQALPVMLSDSLVADTVATLASVDPVLGDVDR